MANAGAIRAGRAFVELFADDSKLVRGLKAAGRKLQAWGAGIRSAGLRVMAAGVAMLAPMLLSVKTFMSVGDALDKMAGRTGASVEFLSALGHAAELGGSNLATMEVAIRKIQRSAYDAAAGTKTQQEAFEKLGVSVRGVDGNLKSTEQLFTETVTALGAMTNHTEKAALAQVLFGRSGTMLLPMLSGLVSGMKEAKDLGLVLSPEDTKAAAELTDAWTRVKSSLKMAVIQIGAALAPALQTVAEWIAKICRPLIDWIKENKKLVATIAAVAAGVVAAGAALVVLGAVISAAGVVMGALAAVGAVIAKAFALLVSPVGILVAGFAALAYKTGLLSSALSWLGGVFRGLKNIATKAFKGIADAMKAGDLRLAIKIAGAALKVTWSEAVLWVRTQWSKATHGIASALVKAWYGALRVLRRAWASFSSWAQWEFGSLWLAVQEDLGAISPEEKKARQKKLQEETDKAAEVSVADLNTEEAEQLKILEEDRETSLRDAKRAVAEARNKFSELVGDAKRKAARGTIYGEPPKKGPGDPDPMPAGAKGPVLGTFNAMVAGRLASGGAAERTAKATEESAGHLRHMRRKFTYTGPQSSATFK